MKNEAKHQKNKEEDDGLGENTVEKFKGGIDGNNNLISGLEEAPQNHPANDTGKMKILME